MKVYILGRLAMLYGEVFESRECFICKDLGSSLAVLLLAG